MRVRALCSERGFSPGRMRVGERARNLDGSAPKRLRVQRVAERLSSATACIFGEGLSSAGASNDVGFRCEDARMHVRAEFVAELGEHVRSGIDPDETRLSVERNCKRFLLSSYLQPDAPFPGKLAICDVARNRAGDFFRRQKSDDELETESRILIVDLLRLLDVDDRALAIALETIRDFELGIAATLDPLIEEPS